MNTRGHHLHCYDARLRRSGVPYLVGVDEVGRGSLAGPVVAVAVILPEDMDPSGIDDSKQLTAPARSRVAEVIRERAIAAARAFVGPRTIDTVNIRQATLRAMKAAVLRLAVQLRATAGAPALASGLVLVDGCDAIPGLPFPQRALVGGDAMSLCVAAASILAKSIRDAYMCRLGDRFPQYGFERHKGYATEEHLVALQRYGPCAQHRWSYAPVAQVPLLII